MKLEMASRLVLTDTAHLLPSGIAASLHDAWLSAPVAGFPLFRRLLEPFARNFEELGVLPGPGADSLVRLTRARPVFGKSVELLEKARRADVVMPALGVRDQWPDPWQIDPTWDLSFLLKLNRLSILGFAAPKPRGAVRGGCLFGARARMHERADATGVNAIGAYSRVAAQAVLDGNVFVGERCYVGAGARLKNCVLLDGVVIKGGAVLTDSVLTQDGPWTAAESAASLRTLRDRGA